MDRNRPFCISLLLALVLALAGCGESDTNSPATSGDDSEYPPHALVGTYLEMKADLAAPRHPADGGGLARIKHSTEVHSGDRARFELRYEAGPLGVAVGGGVYFLPEPFWGWSRPQSVESGASGFTTVNTDAEGVELEVETLGNGILLITIGGRALASGEFIDLVYGAGESHARVDTYGERGARLWFAVDGDGDGIRKIVDESPTVEVLPRTASRIVVTLTSTAASGEEVFATLAALDPMGNSCPGFRGDVELLDVPDGFELPDRVTLGPDDRGCRRIPFAAATPGTLRIRARAQFEAGEDVAVSNPLWIAAGSANPLPILWADLHGHSNFSDGTGTPEDYFRYARDAAALDVIALTDHDHYGVRFLDQHEEMWDEIERQVRAFHQPGRFVTVLGYEWTSWLYGHRHVLYFQDHGDVHGWLDPDSQTPTQLWQRLEGETALTLAHHSAGAPIPTDWSFAPDPRFEPVTEIMSVHGSSEAADSPQRIAGAIPGNYVRDVLDSGTQLGFIGSGDSHDGHPGLPHLNPLSGYRSGPSGTQLGRGGLAAILTDDHTRLGVYEAMRRRAVYATSGPRIILDLSLSGHPMGATVEAAKLPAEPELELTIIATAPLRRLDLIRKGNPVRSLELEGEMMFQATIPLETLDDGDFVYIRVEQQDDGLAWSSPVFIR